MRKNTYRVYSTALFIILGVAMCADGLAAIQGGFWIMAILILIAGRLIFIAESMHRADQAELERRRRRRAAWESCPDNSYYHGDTQFTSQINKEWRERTP